jgi:hypothetical protein
MVPDDSGNLSEIFKEMINSKLDVVYTLDRTLNRYCNSCRIWECAAYKSTR